MGKRRRGNSIPEPEGVGGGGHSKKKGEGDLADEVRIVSCHGSRRGDSPTFVAMRPEKEKESRSGVSREDNAAEPTLPASSGLPNLNSAQFGPKLEFSPK